MSENGKNSYPDISDIFNIDGSGLPDKPIEKDKSKPRSKEKILTSPEGARFLPKDVRKKMKKDEKKRRRAAAAKKLKTRLIIILSILAAALVAAGIITWKIKDAKKPVVIPSKAAVETIERSHSANAVVFADGRTTTAVFIDNDYDVHFIERNLKAEIKTTSGITVNGTVTDIKEEKPGSVLFRTLSSALLDDVPELSFYTVTVTLDDPEGLLKNADKVTARVITKSVEKAVAIPTSAVFTADAQSYVWIYHPLSKKLTRQDVSVGISSDDKVEIIRGLSKGDQVISGASCTSAELYDGIKVKVK